MSVIDKLYEHLNSFLKKIPNGDGILSSAKAIEPDHFKIAALLLFLSGTDDLRGVIKLSKARCVF
ncbi:MAG: hypothetical protein ACR2L1_11380 [Pyrinomonadaceae bacterium]